jgi:hypothetical protein
VTGYLVLWRELVDLYHDPLFLADAPDLFNPSIHSAARDSEAVGDLREAVIVAEKVDEPDEIFALGMFRLWRSVVA